MLANYEVHCDENWLTHRVEIERTVGNDVKTLSLNVESLGVWRTGRALPGVRGCDDVDLALTPATNTVAALFQLDAPASSVDVHPSESLIAVGDETGRVHVFRVENCKDW